MQAAVELRHVHKWFGRTHALRDVTLSLAAGRLIGLMGTNGAGKSTLLGLLAGVALPSRGRVSIFGQPPSPATKRRTAYMPSEEYLHRWMSIGEVIRLYTAMFDRFNPQRAAALLEEARLDSRRRVGDLSKGQEARLGVVLAFARAADLYLLDEPLANVDPASRRYVINLLLREFRPGESTILMTTHHVEEVEELLDDAIFLADGQIVCAGEADSLRTETGKSLVRLAEEVTAG